MGTLTDLTDDGRKGGLVRGCVAVELGAGADVFELGEVDAVLAGADLGELVGGGRGGGEGTNVLAVDVAGVAEFCQGEGGEYGLGEGKDFIDAGESLGEVADAGETFDGFGYQHYLFRSQEYSRIE